MEEKDKIIISTGHEPEEGLETPHFDAEETLLAARPVVPLTEEAIEAARSTSRRSTRVEFTAQPLSKRIPVLALVIIAAVSVGLAGGLAIGLYQGRQHMTAPVTAQSSSTTTADTRLKQQPPAEEASNRQLPSIETVADRDQTAEPVVVSQTESGQIVVPEEAPETKESPQISDLPKPERETATDRKKIDEKPAPPPPAEPRKKAKDDRDGGDDDDGKKQKATRRRRAIERDRDYGDAPPRIERAGQELNRIREIFEGSRP
jgi:hypothetical protein